MILIEIEIVCVIFILYWLISNMIHIRFPTAVTVMIELCIQTL